MADGYRSKDGSKYVVRAPRRGCPYRMEDVAWKGVLVERLSGSKDIWTDHTHLAAGSAEAEGEGWLVAGEGGAVAAGGD